MYSVCCPPGWLAVRARKSENMKAMTTAEHILPLQCGPCYSHRRAGSAARRFIADSLWNLTPKIRHTFEFFSYLLNCARMSQRMKNVKSSLIEYQRWTTKLRPWNLHWTSDNSYQVWLPLMNELFRGLKVHEFACRWKWNGFSYEIIYG